MDWDFIGPLLLLAIIYGLPELFRKRRKGQQQEFPEPEEIEVVLPPPVEPPPVIQAKIPPIGISQQQPSFSDEKQTADTKTEVSSVVSKQMFISRHTIVNGLIFSEILQKPKAFRSNFAGSRTRRGNDLK